MWLCNMAAQLHRRPPQVFTSDATLLDAAVMSRRLAEMAREVQSALARSRALEGDSRATEEEAGARHSLPKVAGGMMIECW